MCCCCDRRLLYELLSFFFFFFFSGADDGPASLGLPFSGVLPHQFAMATNSFSKFSGVIGGSENVPYRVWWVFSSSSDLDREDV